MRLGLIFERAEFISMLKMYISHSGIGIARDQFIGARNVPLNCLVANLDLCLASEMEETNQSLHFDLL